MTQALDFLRYGCERLMMRITHPRQIRGSVIDKTAKVCFGSQIHFCRINRYSYVGAGCAISHADIGAFCSIAENVVIGGGAHPINRVST